MRNMQIAAAVAAVLGTSAALAGTTANMTGASAQRSFWITELKANVCAVDASGNPTDFVEYRAYDSALPTTTAQPDFRAYRCTSRATLPAEYGAFAGGQVVTMAYSAELGSIWGVVPFIKAVNAASNLPTTHLFLNPDDVNCTVNGNTLTGVPKGNYIGCSISGYSDATDSVASGTALVAQTPDIGVTDVEPTLFLGNGINWPVIAGTGSLFTAANAPSKADLAALKSSVTAPSTVINGQVFQIIVDTTVATYLPKAVVAATYDASGNVLTTTTMPNLSFSAISSIFNGRHITWSEVAGVTDPGVGGTNIVVCRRDPGSGSQVSAQLYFEGGSTGAACVAAPKAFVAPTALGKGRMATTSIVVNNSTDDITAACIPNNIGHAIGLKSNGGDGSNYKAVAIDGVAPSAHNAANGTYHFWYETYGIDNTANSAATADEIALAQGLLARAKVAADLPFESSAVGRNSAFGLAGVGGNVATVAGVNPAATVVSGVSFGAPTGLTTRGGNSCTLYPTDANTL